LPKEKLEEIAALGDHWKKRMVAGRELRGARLCRRRS